MTAWERVVLPMRLAVIAMRTSVAIWIATTEKEQTKAFIISKCPSTLFLMSACQNHRRGAVRRSGHEVDVGHWFDCV